LDYRCSWLRPWQQSSSLRRRRVECIRRRHAYRWRSPRRRSNHSHCWGGGCRSPGWQQHVWQYSGYSPFNRYRVLVASPLGTRKDHALQGRNDRHDGSSSDSGRSSAAARYECATSGQPGTAQLWAVSCRCPRPHLDKPRFHTLEKPVTKQLTSLARASKESPTCLVPRCVPLVGGCGFRSEGRF
jgi:hypothetical protein